MTATAGLVDFHCHLDLYPDFPAAVEEASDEAPKRSPIAWVIALLLVASGVGVLYFALK